MHKITHILFDIGGVVVINNQINYEDFDKELSLEKGSVKKIIDDCFHKSAKGEKIEIKNYIETTYKNTITFEQYNNVLKKIYGAEKVNEELVEWINNHKTQFHIHALSNNTKALKKLLTDKFDIVEIFEHIFNSAEIGLAKPDPKLFTYVLDKLGAKAKECLFVDDNLHNTEAAKALGFHVVHFTNFKEFKKTFYISFLHFE